MPTPPDVTPDLLFVYGSLVRAHGHPMGARLRAEATFVGAGTVGGRLYRVSWYPGAALTNDARDVVHGEIYRLADPPRTLEWLDAYESITPSAIGVAASDEYERRVVTVALADATKRACWMYVYRRPTEGLVHIADGRWTG